MKRAKGKLRNVFFLFVLWPHSDRVREFKNIYIRIYATIVVMQTMMELRAEMY